MFAVRVALVRAAGTEVLAHQAAGLAQRAGAIPAAGLSQQVGAELRVPAVPPAEAPQRRGAVSARAKWPAAVALAPVERAAPQPRARPATQ